MIKYINNIIWGTEKPVKHYKLINPKCLNWYAGHYCNNPFGSPCNVPDTEKGYDFMKHLTEDEKKENLKYWSDEYNIVPNRFEPDVNPKVDK